MPRPRFGVLPILLIELIEALVMYALEREA
jgi:hypothetical protein